MGKNREHFFTCLGTKNREKISPTFLAVKLSFDSEKFHCGGGNCSGMGATNLMASTAFSLLTKRDMFTARK